MPPAFTPADYRWGTAADRESHGLGQTPPPQVTAGEFGKALASIDPPAVVTTLLRLSKTFMAIAATLDKRYVYLWHPTENRHRRLVTSDNGIVTAGAFAGRRVLDVKKNPAGSWFQPFEDPDNTGYYDVIWIEKPGQREIGPWIEVIAHEATHACHLATRTSAMPAKLANFVKASIAEEIETRRIEALVLKEIGKTTAGKRELAGFVPSTGRTDAHEVERDFFPSHLRRTYLEHFALTKLAQDAIKRERLSHRERKAKDAEVAALPFNAWRSRKFSSDYAKLRFWQRVIHFRWERLRAIHGSNFTAFQRGKEILVQEHANAFLGELVRYTPRPVKSGASTTKPLAPKARP